MRNQSGERDSSRGITKAGSLSNLATEQVADPRADVYAARRFLNALASFKDTGGILKPSACATDVAMKE